MATSTQPQNLLDYLCDLSRKELDELYTDQFTVMIIFRTLPPLSKQYIMRMISVQSLLLPEASLGLWIKTEDKRTMALHRDAIRRLRSLKILIRGTAKRMDESGGDEPVCRLNGPFRSTLLSTLTTTNPLQYHMQTVYHPLFYSSTPPSIPSPTTASIAASPTSAAAAGGGAVKKQTKGKQSLLATEATVTPGSSSIVVRTANSTTETAEQRRIRRQEELSTLRWDMSLPSIYRGNPQMLLHHYYLTTTHPHKYSRGELVDYIPLSSPSSPLTSTTPAKTTSTTGHEATTIPTPTHQQNIYLELPEMDTNFLDIYGQETLDNVSKFMLGISASNRPLSPLLQSLLTKNGLLTHAEHGSSSFRGALVPTSQGIQFLLKEPQDRVWLLLLYYFSAVREQQEQQQQQQQQNPEIPMPTIFEVFKFLFHLSFTPLGTGVPLIQLFHTTPSSGTAPGVAPSTTTPAQGGHQSIPQNGTTLASVDPIVTPQQQLILSHFAELGLLYPLESSSLFPDYSETPPSLVATNTTEKYVKHGRRQGLKATKDEAAMALSTNGGLQSPPAPQYDLFKLVNPTNNGIIAYYPTKLIINLSTTIKGSQQQQQQQQQQQGETKDDSDMSSQQHRRRRRLNLDEHSDDEDANGDSEQATTTSNTKMMTSDGRVVTSLSSSAAAAAAIPFTETQLAHASIMSTHPDIIKKQRVLIIETTLKVYAFTNDELLLVLLSFFVDLRVKLPNMSVGLITRRSIRRALEYHVSTETILHWLTLHCHPRMITNSLGVLDSLGRYINGRDHILPIKVKDQINLWSTEKNRLYSCEDVVMLSEFDTSSSSAVGTTTATTTTSTTPRNEFQDILELCYAISTQAVVFADQTQQRILVRKTFFPQIRTAIQAYRQTHQSAGK